VRRAAREDHCADRAGEHAWLRRKPRAASFGNEERTMPKYVIEREIPGVGRLPAESMRTIAQKSCSVLQQMGPSIQWVESYVTDDRIYCVYIAPDEAAIREHARLGGFPANRISKIKRMIDPTTAE
jgi:hypothetical protein